jgi:phosphatidylserine decarboxylase
VREWTYEEDDEPKVLAQGDEMGRFLLGSTVVLLWPKDTIAFQPDWQAGRAVRMGEAMGQAV